MIPFCIIISKTCAVQPSPPAPKHWFQHWLQTLTAHMISFCIIISKMCLVKHRISVPTSSSDHAHDQILHHNFKDVRGQTISSRAMHANPHETPQGQNIKFQHRRQTLTAHMIPFCIIISKTCAVQPSSPGTKHWFQHCLQILTALMIPSEEHAWIPLNSVSSTPIALSSSKLTF